MSRLANKVAIVTGAASGIGRASAVLFAQQGAIVVCSDVSKKGLSETIALIKTGKGVAVPCDVSDEEQVKSLVNYCVQTYGRLDIMFANAGIIGAYSDLFHTNPSQLEQVLKVNVVGAFLCVKYAAAAMKKNEKGGSILLTASVAGVRAGAGSVIYSASKAAVISLAQTSANELAGTGIRVNAVCPGLVETGMTSMIFDMARKRGTENKIGQLNPTRRAGLTEEIGNVAVFLVSDEASYINGQAINVCGGLSSSLPVVPPKDVKTKPKL